MRLIIVRSLASCRLIFFFRTGQLAASSVLSTRKMVTPINQGFSCALSLMTAPSITQVTGFITSAVLPLIHVKYDPNPFPSGIEEAIYVHNEHRAAENPPG
ncbi:hypothetical protein BDR07DRAFT_1405306 [Suillus spraguei]|nr:hypothetical protein BDR07DRAFT_1405306 [Suillus spraguei]